MLDAHAHVMQVKLCKANTRGVTPYWLVLPTYFFLVLFLICSMVNMHNGIHPIKSHVNLMPKGLA